MEWVKDFYSQQYKLMKRNDEDILHEQEGLLKKLEALSDQPMRKILELGGGEGHFAITAAKHGYEVTVIELIPEAAQHIQKLAKEHRLQNQIRIVNGDFYTVELNDRFDVVCYWDGFGIGSDFDQHKLLERVQNWLKPNGSAFIDIYTPWYWAKVAGREMQIEQDVSRKYDFDALNSRMLDTWWNHNDETENITQSLRCYSPADLELLMKDLQLKLVHCEPGGEVDYEKRIYNEQVPMHRAMSFLAKFRKD